jgi:hypothetical protein
VEDGGFPPSWLKVRSFSRSPSRLQALDAVSHPAAGTCITAWQDTRRSSHTHTKRRSAKGRFELTNKMQPSACLRAALASATPGGDTCNTRRCHLSDTGAHSRLALSAASRALNSSKAARALWSTRGAPGFRSRASIAAASCTSGLLQHVGYIMSKKK